MLRELAKVYTRVFKPLEEVTKFDVFYSSRRNSVHSLEVPLSLELATIERSTRAKEQESRGAFQRLSVVRLEPRAPVEQLSSSRNVSNIESCRGVGN